MSLYDETETQSNRLTNTITDYITNRIINTQNLSVSSKDCNFQVPRCAIFDIPTGYGEEWCAILFHVDKLTFSEEQSVAGSRVLQIGPVQCGN